MELSFLYDIFNAIKQDDISAFNQIVDKRRSVLSISFGRFPLLSVCYLYKSAKIVAEYERTLSTVADYIVVEELNEIYEKFRKVAKKYLRFFIGECVVSPLEMLAITNNANYLRKVFAKQPKTPQINNSLVNIYQNLHGQDIKIEQNTIAIRRQKMSRKMYVALIAIMLVAVIFSGLFAGAYVYADSYYGKGTVEKPLIIRDATQLQLAFKKDIGYYKLANDIVLTQPISVDFGGVLDGQGHTLKLEYNIENSFIGNLSGQISNLNLIISDQALNLEQDFAFVVDTNNGQIDGVNVFVNVEAEESVDKEDLYLSIVCRENNGTINNCNVSSNINFSGDGVGNAYLSAFSAINNGKVSRCEITEDSIFVTDTVDIGGIVAENTQKGQINACKNYAKISQYTASESWHPNCAGVAMVNNGLIENCINYGQITAESVADNKDCQIYLGGIVSVNNSRIAKSKNLGKLNAKSEKCQIFLGGVASINNNASAVIEASGEEGQLYLQRTAEDMYMFVGGIVSLNIGTVKDCFFNGKIGIKNSVTFGCAIIGYDYFYSGSKRINNFALISKDLEYFALTINYWNELNYIVEGCTWAETEQQLFSSEVYW